MRSHEERVAETKRRIAKMEREKRLRRNTITMASAVAACLVLLIGASLAMPGIAARIQTGDYSGFETAASIFHGGAALGYIVIGLLAFLLGVCVTVLCFRLRQMNREDDQDRESEGMRMELIENLLQLLVTFVGALLSGIAYRKSRRQAYFLLLCFYGCFALGALYWTLYLLLFDTTPRVFYVSEFGWVASVIFLRILQATLSTPEERSLPLPQGVACACVRRAAAGVLLHLRGHSLQPDLVRHDDMALSYCAIRGLVYANGADGRGAEYAVLPHRRAVLCQFAEYLLWTAGCFWPDTSPASPTFWCDMLLTLAILGLLPATRRAVAA